MARVFSEHKAVRQDIQKIHSYVAEYDRLAANRVAEAIIAAILEIAESPEQFPRFSPETFQTENLHRVVVSPYRNYLIFYVLKRDAVRVLYVHHGARDFEARYHRETRW